MITHKYIPHGVCSREITVVLDDDGIIQDVEFLGGCSGNTQGISKLAKGRPAEEVIKMIKGVDCGGRGTSCPDQLASCLEEALELL